MSFPYRLPMILDGQTSCNDLTGDDPDHICAENIILQNPDILIAAKKSAVESGVTSAFPDRRYSSQPSERFRL